MITVKCTMRPVWSLPGRRGCLTKRAAYHQAAWQAYQDRYGCGERYDNDAEGQAAGRHRCGQDWCYEADHDHVHKVVDRLSRWLMWRDGRRA